MGLQRFLYGASKYRRGEGNLISGPCECYFRTQHTNSIPELSRSLVVEDLHLAIAGFASVVEEVSPRPVLFPFALFVSSVETIRKLVFSDIASSIPSRKENQIEMPLLWSRQNGLVCHICQQSRRKLTERCRICRAQYTSAKGKAIHKHRHSHSHSRTGVGHSPC
jgi:hypothetical protein